MAAVDDYIFLYQEDFMSQRSQNSAKLLVNTKDEILQNAIYKQNIRMQNRFNSISDVTMENLEELLHPGRLLQDVNDNVSADLASREFFPETIQALEQLLEECSEGFSSLTDFSNKLGVFLKTLDDSQAKLAKQYTQAIRQRFFKRHIGYEDSTIARLQADEEIFEAMMEGKYKGGFLSLANLENTNSSIINSDIVKIFSLAAMLSDDGFKTFAKGPDSSFKLESVTRRLEKWLANFKALLGEYAMGKAFIKGENKFFETLRNLGLNLNKTSLIGGKTFEVQKIFSADPQQEEMFQQLQKYRKNNGLSQITRTSKKTAKSDIALGESENSVYGIIGVSVKDYTEVNINDPATPAVFHIQSGTSLLTLLMREASFSTSELITFINMGVAIPKGTDFLSAQWTRAKEQLAYRAVLAALAGLDNNQDQVYYMALNGRIFTIQEILQSIRNTVMQNNHTGVTLSDIEGNGFDRSFLMDLNEKLPQKSDETIEQTALRRSSEVRSAVLSEFQETKIKVSITLTQLQNLIN